MSDTNFEPPPLSAAPQIAAQQKRSRTIVVAGIAILVLVMIVAYFSMRASFGL